MHNPKLIARTTDGDIISLFVAVMWSEARVKELPIIGGGYQPSKER
jgi:hypothetical protein